MKLIKPSEISSKIMSLIEESDEFVLLVSPYVKISKWYKLLKKLDNLKARKVPFSFVIRDENSNSNSAYELDTLSYSYSAIPDLHAKLYLNEKYAIVTSLNLLLSSEINTIEIGYQTETPEEYDELIDFCKRHLSVNFESFIPSSNDVTPVTIKDNEKHWIDNVLEILEQKLKKEINATCYDTSLTFDSGKYNYDCYIWNQKTNVLRLSVSLPNKAYNKFNNNIEYLEKLVGSKIEHYPASLNHSYKIYVNILEDIRSENMSHLVQHENPIVTNKLIEVIYNLDNFL